MTDDGIDKECEGDGATHTLIAEVRRLQTQDKAHREAGENMSAETAALHKELHAAREALRFYADEKNWEAQDLSNGLSVSGIANDGGEHARKALSSLRSDEKGEE